MSDRLEAQYRELKLGEKLRAARMLRGMSLSEVAQKSGLCEVLVAQIEGDKVSPTVGVLLGMTEAVGISLAQLFGESSIDHGIEVVTAGQGDSRSPPIVDGRGPHTPPTRSFHD